MLAALAVVIMLLAYVPYFMFAMPALAGALFGILLIELNGKWAFGAYVAAAILTLLLCEKEAGMLFVGVFGYYPIVKTMYEKIHNPIVEWLFKWITFNLAAVLSYLVIIFVFQIPLENMGAFGQFTVIILLALGNVMFVFYDLALSKLYHLYYSQLHPRISRLLK